HPRSRRRRKRHPPALGALSDDRPRAVARSRSGSDFPTSPRCLAAGADRGEGDVAVAPAVAGGQERARAHLHATLRPPAQPARRRAGGTILQSAVGRARGCAVRRWSPGALILTIVLSAAVWAIVAVACMTVG